MIFARLLRLVIVVAVIAAGLIYLKPVNLAVGSKPEFASYQVSAKDLELSCNGATVLAGGESGTSVTNFERVGNALTSISYSAIQNTKLAGFIGNTILGYGVRQDLSDRIKNPASVRVLDASGTTEQGSELLTANQLQLAKDKSISGLLAAPCLRPQSEFWFVGGSTSIGREALLILTNPSPVDATVDLNIFTENGVSYSAGLSGISVPKSKTTVIPLSSFVLRAQSIAVHVKSQGGSITALIQQKAIRGTSASGADYIAPSDIATKEAVFPGILVRGASDTAKFRKTGSKYGDVQNMLRVFVPGEKDATITFQVLGTDVETFGTVLSVTAPAGKVSDFAIQGLQNGDYFGILNSDVEVLSSLRLVRARATTDRFVDFAWLNRAAGFTNTRYVAVPDSGITKLSLVNVGSKPTTVTLKLGAATIKRSVQAASAEVVLVGAGLGVGIIPSSAEIYANLIIDIDGRLAALPVLDEKNISGQVEVYIH